MDAVASVTHAFDVSLEILLHFISAVPREFTDSGGMLIISGMLYLIHFITASYFCKSLFFNTFFPPLISLISRFFESKSSRMAFGL